MTTNLAVEVAESAPPVPPKATGSAFLFICFFLSGATGLVYEVVWLRTLGLIFGHTVYAITTVLAAFMAGLALGSFLLGRRVARIQNLVRAYGWLEVGIGVTCALVPVVLGIAAMLYLWLHGALGLSYGAFSLIQFVIVFSLLLVPTTLMGGTLPVLSQALVRQRVGVGRTVGSLYAMNTAGAVAGVALAGYLLIPMLGNRTMTLAAALANVAVGVVAIVYSSTHRATRHWDAEELRISPTTPRIAPEPTALPTPPGALRLGTWLTVAGLGVSGATSMLYEVSWTRALILVIGSSTYAFTAVLVAFLMGIAGGSALYSWVWGRRPATSGTFAVIQAGIGLAVLVILLAFQRMPDLYLLALSWSDAPGFVQFVQLCLSAACFLLATLLIGATFPCAVAVAARDLSRAGRDVGSLYAVNTLGAIVGTVLAGFVLLPNVGVHASIKVGIITNLLLAGVLFWAARGRIAVWRWAGVAAALVIATVVAFVPAWDRGLMSSGPAIYAKRYLGAPDARASQGASQVLFYRDGLSATVSVHGDARNIFLRVNGKTDAGTSGDMPTQLMSGHLPMLFHSQPRAVLVIGLGSGITAGAVASHPVERLDLVEIEPAVVEATQFFAPWHGDVLKDPRVRMMIADGRNFLLTTPVRYDVIISEPSNPWIGGLASLFSVEFFDLARQRLRPGGIMLQWVQGYNLLPDDFRMIVRTFRTAFPATSIWNTVGGDYLLLGRTQTTPLDLNLLKTRWDNQVGTRRHLEQIGVQGWAGPLGYFMLGEADTARFAEGTALNTDDRLPLEFSAPRALYLDTTGSNSRLIRSFKLAELPEVTSEARHELERADVRYWIGKVFLRRDATADALSHFERATRLDPSYLPPALWTGAVYMRLGRPSQALESAQGVLERHPQNVDALVMAGLASEANRRFAEAIAFLERASKLDPGNGRVQEVMTRVQFAALRGGTSPGSPEDLTRWLPR